MRRLISLAAVAFGAGGLMSSAACTSSSSQAATAEASGGPDSSPAKQGSEGTGTPARNRDSRKPAAPEGEVSARRVEVGVVERSDARLTLRLPGEVEGSRDAVLAAALGGYVERVPIKNGAEVRRGQVLAQVDAATHRARLAQTEVELAAADRELKRAQRLGDAIARAQLDAAESRHAAAVAAQQTAKIAVSRAVIRAPFAGSVSGVEIEAGEVAPPGAPVLRLVQLDPVKVSITVSDRDVVVLREGIKARVTTDASAGAFEGEVVHIDPAADLQTRAFTVEVEVANPERRLLPGMIATVHVEEEVERGQLVIPQDYVVTKRDGLGVFVADGRVARWRPVKLGQVVRDEVVVTEGLKRGDHLVVTGHRELVDGDPLIIARRGVCCTSGRVVFSAE